MADSLKEIYAGTISMTDVAATGGVTLATTNSTTQYVIKDVTVNGGPLGGSSDPTLKVNATEVAKATQSLTGSEIVDVSSSLRYQAFPAAPTLKTLRTRLVNPSHELVDFTSGEVNGTLATSTADVRLTPLKHPSVVFTAEHSNLGIADDGDVFFTRRDGNATNGLLKLSGGFTGTQSTPVSLDYAWIVFNNVDTYYYGIGDAILRAYNINSEAVSTVTSSPAVVLATSSYPCASYMENGMILYWRSGNSEPNTLHIINPTTGQRTEIGPLPSVTLGGEPSGLCGYYDTVTSRYTIYRRQGSSLYRTRLLGPVTLGSAYTGGFYHSSIVVSFPTGHHRNGYTRCTGNSYTWADHKGGSSTPLTTVDFDSGLVTNGVLSPSYGTLADTFNFKRVAAAASIFTDTVGIRVTGVKSTT